MIFPTVISKAKIDITEQDKQNIFDIVYNNIDENGYSMDFLGYTKIHHEKSLEHIYKQVVSLIREHLSFMNVDHTNIDINIVKSWLNLTEERVNTRHNHSEAHYSFTIYPNVPEHAKKYLRLFRKEKHPNEIYEGFFDNCCNEWELQNSSSCQFLPEEGDVFIFPSSMDHDTVLMDGSTPSGMENVKDYDHIKDMRICIGGDVIFTSNIKTNNHRILQPIADWKTF